MTRLAEEVDQNAKLLQLYRWYHARGFSLPNRLHTLSDPEVHVELARIRRFDAHRARGLALPPDLLDLGGTDTAAAAAAPTPGAARPAAAPFHPSGTAATAAAAVAAVAGPSGACVPRRPDAPTAAGAIAAQPSAIAAPRHGAKAPDHHTPSAPGSKSDAAVIPNPLITRFPLADLPLLPLASLPSASDLAISQPAGALHPVGRRSAAAARTEKTRGGGEPKAAVAGLTACLTRGPRRPRNERLILAGYTLTHLDGVDITDCWRRGSSRRGRARPAAPVPVDSSEKRREATPARPSEKEPVGPNRAVFSRASAKASERGGKEEEPEGAATAASPAHANKENEQGLALGDEKAGENARRARRRRKSHLSSALSSARTVSRRKRHLRALAAESRTVEAAQAVEAVDLGPSAAPERNGSAQDALLEATLPTRSPVTLLPRSAVAAAVAADGAAGTFMCGASERTGPRACSSKRKAPRPAMEGDAKGRTPRKRRRASLLTSDAASSDAESGSNRPAAAADMTGAAADAVGGLDGQRGREAAESWAKIALVIARELRGSERQLQRFVFAPLYARYGPEDLPGIAAAWAEAETLQPDIRLSRSESSERYVVRMLRDGQYPKYRFWLADLVAKLTAAHLATLRVSATRRNALVLALASREHPRRTDLQRFHTPTP
jgi:hypothetical protein